MIRSIAHHTIALLQRRLRRRVDRGLQRPIAASTWAATTVCVDSVDDPERPIRLIRATGSIGPHSIDRLLQSWEHLTAPHSLHLDLFDAQITEVSTMRRLESALDQLELRGIHVRLVGLDPQHPSLAA